MASVRIRYIVEDVEDAVEFYTTVLGFEVEMNPAPGFAMLARDDLQLLLNAPGAGGAGRAGVSTSGPEPGGWNRFQIQVDDLDRALAGLRSADADVPSDIVDGKGGRQALIVDPSGNLVELFEPHGDGEERRGDDDAG